LGAITLVSDLFLGVRIAYVVITSILFFVLFAAYIRFRNSRLLFITIGFGLFFIHGLLSIPEIISNTYDVYFTDSLHLLFDSVGLVFILLGTLQDLFFKKRQD